MKNNIVVHRPEHLTKHWAQRIVNYYAKDAKVYDIDVQSVSIGTTTRIRLNVNHNAPEVLPSRWFIKTPSLVLKSRLITLLPRLLHKEIHFYNYLAQEAPLQLPPILAAQSRFGRGTTLVMADLEAMGYRAGQSHDRLTLTQAQQVVQHLGQLHARFWQNQSFFDKNRWLNGRNLQVERFLGSVLAVSLMKRGLSLAGRLVPEVIHEPALRYAANRAKMIALLNNVEHLTLTHYDCHPGNFFWNEKGPGFLDWQLVRIGEGVGDIAYFLATSLAPEDRKIYEKKLLSDYLAVLKQLGVAGLNEEQLYQRYQAHLCYAFEAMIVTLAIGDMMDLTSNLELIRRTSAAVFDNDSFKALLT